MYAIRFCLKKSEANAVFFLNYWTFERSFSFVVCLCGMIAGSRGMIIVKKYAWKSLLPTATRTGFPRSVSARSRFRGCHASEPAFFIRRRADRTAEPVHGRPPPPIKAESVF